MNNRIQWYQSIRQTEYFIFKRYKRAMNNGGKYGNSIRDARLFAALNPITVQNETLLRQHNLKRE